MSPSAIKQSHSSSKIDPLWICVWWRSVALERRCPGDGCNKRIWTWGGWRGGGGFKVGIYVRDGGGRR